MLLCYMSGKETLKWSYLCTSFVKEEILESSYLCAACAKHGKAKGAVPVHFLCESERVKDSKGAVPVYFLCEASKRVNV